jgi:hypothetical protein
MADALWIERDLDRGYTHIEDLQLLPFIIIPFLYFCIFASIDHLHIVAAAN